MYKAKKDRTGNTPKPKCCSIPLTIFLLYFMSLPRFSSTPPLSAFSLLNILAFSLLPLFRLSFILFHASPSLLSFLCGPFFCLRLWSIKIAPFYSLLSPPLSSCAYPRGLFPSTFLPYFFSRLSRILSSLYISFILPLIFWHPLFHSLRPLAYGRFNALFSFLFLSPFSCPRLP